jgi:hypothetical protein
MARFQAQASDVYEVEVFFSRYPDLSHVRVRRRGELLTLESGPFDHPQHHARMRRMTVHLWRLEMPSGSNRWSATPFRDQLHVLLEMLIFQFPWTLAP